MLLANLPIQIKTPLKERAKRLGSLTRFTRFAGRYSVLPYPYRVPRFRVVMGESSRTNFQGIGFLQSC